jgi:hypothetical protein
MDYSWQPYPIINKRVTTFFVHNTSPLDVLQGISEGLEVTRFVTDATQTPKQTDITVTWRNELDNTNQPTFGNILEIKFEGITFWIGIIQVTDLSLKSGSKSLKITARSRESTPMWKDTRRLTDVYPVSTALDYIAHQIGTGIGLSADELTFIIPGTTVHSSTQLADLPPWQMFSMLMLPSGLEPFVDAKGRLKAISRDTTREADVVLDDNRRLIEVLGTKTKPTTSEVIVNWLDPNLTEVAQVDRILDRATITAGFFKLTQTHDVKFSADETQRARDTRLVTKQTVNSGLLPVATEHYEQLSVTGGRITLHTSAFVPGLATTALAFKELAHFEPDLVEAFFVGVTTPLGRLTEFAADLILMLAFMSIGTGSYEVWGTPYDYVHSRNRSTAYNKNAKDWEVSLTEIQNDFVMNEQQAEACAARELIYAYRAGTSYNIKIIDDPRIEVGDIIQLKDGSRSYVLDYSRTLKSGAPAELSITGFKC